MDFIYKLLCHTVSTFNTFSATSCNSSDYLVFLRPSAVADTPCGASRHLWQDAGKKLWLQGLPAKSADRWLFGCGEPSRWVTPRKASRQGPMILDLLDPILRQILSHSLEYLSLQPHIRSFNSWIRSGRPTCKKHFESRCRVVVRQWLHTPKPENRLESLTSPSCLLVWTCSSSSSCFSATSGWYWETRWSQPHHEPKGCPEEEHAIHWALWRGSCH